MRIQLNTPGYLGLIIGLLALIWYLNFGPGAPHSQAQGEKKTPGSFKPTEEIGVEQAVDFPIDI